MSAPDFIVIGAMKCGTSTLHTQLDRQAGVSMSRPKEPCYFSDDAVFADGAEWYRSCFAHAEDGDVRGESSTHYTKRTVHPRTVERMAAGLGDDVRFVYVMRHPLRRMRSQFVHEWTKRRIGADWGRAIERLPELVENGLYWFQLEPYFETFGRERVLPVFLERLSMRPDAELGRIARFVGVCGPVHWFGEADRENVSAERVRRDPLRERVLSLPVFSGVKRALPGGLKERVKRRWRMSEAPAMPAALEREVVARFDADLEELGAALGAVLSCERFDAVVRERTLAWSSGVSAS